MHRWTGTRSTILGAVALGAVSLTAGVSPIGIGSAETPSLGSPLAAGAVLAVEVAGIRGVPADADAVALNVTVANPRADGYLTVFPCGEAPPVASNLNYTRADRAVPNAVVARVGRDRSVCVTSSADVDVIVDVAGYVPPTSAIASLDSPRRLLDTRIGSGAPVGRVGPGVTVVQVAGREGIPSGAAAAVLNVTVVGPAGPGFATVFPCDQPQPVASNLNFVAGDVRPNLVMAGLDGDGRTCVYAMASTHLVIDAIGFVPTGAAGVTRVANPERLLDTRSGLGAPAGPVTAAASAVVQVRGRAGVPAAATAVVLNVTATEGSRDGFVTVYPCGRLPATSSLNHAAGQTVANLVIATLDPDGRVCLFSNVGTHLIADVAAWFEGDAAYRSLPAPERVYDSRVVSTPTTTSTTSTTSPAATSTTSTTSTTTTSTTTTVPGGPIATSAPCHSLVYPAVAGAIVVRDLTDGTERTITAAEFDPNERPVMAADCSGVLIAGAPVGATGLVMRRYGFDASVTALGDVATPLGGPTLIDQTGDGRVLVTTSTGTWNVANGARLYTPDSGFYRPVGAAHDGSVGVLTSALLFNHTFTVHSLTTGQVVRTTTLPAHGLDPMLSPDGLRVAVGTTPDGSGFPPTRTVPGVRLIDGTLVATYPLGEVDEPTRMNWLTDSQVIVCVPGRSPTIWTIGGGVVSTGAPVRAGCPTGG
ncbi:MAG: hypothetical protein NTZ21_17965 [Actinobacteria bacterium]|nr:hypothetical protein [Actinomycetota bacterium]